MFDSALKHAVVCLVLLAGVGAHRMVTRTPVNAEAYHARIKAAVDAIPYRIGEWAGEKVDPPPAAIALLRPNALLGRAYRNPDGTRAVTLVVVQCQDTRDLAGHYPPICYPAHGWRQLHAERNENLVPNHRMPVTSYHFDRSTAFETTEKWIHNLLLLPVTGAVAGMEEVRKAASNHTARQRGAAQIQLVLSGDVPLSDQKELVREFFATLEPVIRDVIDFDASP